MDYYYPYYFISGIFWLLIILLIPGLIIYFIVRALTKKEGRKLTLNDLKKVGVVAAIAILIPSFIYYLNITLFSDIEQSGAVFFMVFLAILFIMTGLIISENITLSTSYLIGGIISLIYVAGVNYSGIDPIIRVLIVGFGLAALIGISYFKLKEKF